MKKKAVLLLLAWLLGGASLACAQPQPGSPWPMLHHDQYHTGRSPYNGPETATLKWTFVTECSTNAISSSPAIAADGTIYLPACGYLYAINPDGTERWRFSPLPGRWSSPAIGADGTIYVTAGDYKFVAVNPDGTLKWETDTIMGGTMGPVIGSGGTIYVGDRFCHLFAFNPDGTLQWVADLPYPDALHFIAAPSVGPDGTIYIGSDRGFLFAIYPNGSLRWQVGRFADYTIGATSFSVEDNTIYTGKRTREDKVATLYAITPEGTVKWTFPVADEIVCTPSIGNDGTVYFGSLYPAIGSVNDTFYAVNPNGSLKWSFCPRGGVLSSAAIDSDGTIYFGTYLRDTTDNHVYALNPDGTLLWSYDLPDVIASSPAIGADGTLYIGCYDGKLYAFGKPTAAEEKDHSRPYSYRLLQNQPNPFRRSTTITYSLPAADRVTLEVYDVTGRLVETLVSERQEAGSHQIAWDREDDRSAIYFYRLKAGDFVSTKKMVLLE